MDIRIFLKYLMTKILIADDHQIFNDGLKTILAPHFNVVSQVFHGRDVIPALLKFNPKIAVLDISFPVISGLELGKEIKKNFTELKIIYLSMYNEANFVQAAIDIGADGYLLKDSSGDDIVSAIQKIENGEQYFDKNLSQNQPNLHHNDYFVRQYSLSKREIEVISLIRQGLSSEKIAVELLVSFETIKSHRKNIFMKLGFNKIAELVQFALKYNL